MRNNPDGILSFFSPLNLPHSSFWLLLALCLLRPALHGSPLPRFPAHGKATSLRTLLVIDELQGPLEVESSAKFYMGWFSVWHFEGMSKGGT